MLRRILMWNVRVSQAFDRLLPPEYSVDGNADFRKSFAPVWLKAQTRVVDVGGGKNPFIPLEQKKQFGVHVTGVDISADELQRAPAGAYDVTLCGDIAAVTGSGDADLCICQAVLEHVRDVEGAFLSISGLLKPGGVALVFVPCRNAVFARLNLLLPEKLKRILLFNIFPQTRSEQGFPSYYNRCTPAEFRLLARAVGLYVEQERHYYSSAYFSFCAPLHILWRLWLMFFKHVARDQAAETFSMALRKAAEA